MRLVETFPFRRLLERSFNSRNRRGLDDRAAVALLVALMAVPLIAVLALAIEVTTWGVVQQKMQRAADLAVLAAANAYNSGLSVQSAAYNGAYVAELNGQAGVASGSTRTWGTLSSSLSDNTITIKQSTPPKTTGATDFMATISVSRPLSLSSIFLSGTHTLKANAIAEVVPAAGAGNYCVLATDTNDTFNAPNAYPYVVYAISGANVSGTCGIYSNAPGTSIYVASSTVASNLTAHGTIYCSPNGGSCTGTQTQNAAVLANPYAGIATPTPSSTCTATNANFTNGGNDSTYAATQNGTATYPYYIKPGTYCGSLNFGNGGGSGVYFAMEPGLYIINTSVSTISYYTYPLYIGQVHLTANGVTIVITSSTSSWPSEVLAFDNGGSSSSFSLTAPTASQAGTGNANGIPGVLIWVDPNWPHATPNGTNATMTVSEGSNLYFEGAIVAPSQNISFQDGGNTTTTCMQLIAYSVLFTAGTSVFNNSGCSALGALPIGGSPKVTLAQ